MMCSCPKLPTWVVLTVWRRNKQVITTQKTHWPNAIFELWVDPNSNPLHKQATYETHGER